MAFRTWRTVLVAALGIGAGAGAGQLGIGYGLGIVRFARTFDTATANHWPAQLAWVSWFAMIAAIAGTVAADRLARQHGYMASLAPRLGFAAVAGLGAATVAPLSMLPARTAQVTLVDPVLATGLCAGLGALLGIPAAVAALSHSPIRRNVAAMTGGVWLLALISVAPSLGPTDPLPAVRLGLLDPAWLGDGVAGRLAVAALPGLALIAGATTGAFARRRGHPVPVVVACGAVGPALLALAYLVAGPGSAAGNYQAVPYWGSVIAVAAGTLGSVLAALLPWPGTAGSVILAGSGRPTESTDQTGSGDPTGGDEPADPDVSPGSRDLVTSRAPATEPEPPIDAEAAAKKAPAKPDPESSPDEAEPGNAKTTVPKQRTKRGNRAGAVPAADEEYVDWVSGLVDPLTEPDETHGSRRR